MKSYRDHLADAVHATEIHSMDRFSWFCRMASPLQPRIRAELPAATLRSYLRLRLRETLYHSFYCRGFAAPIEPQGAGPSIAGGDAAFVKKLSDANQGSGSWDGGWEVKLAREDLRVAQKEGLRLRAGPGEWRRTDEADGAPGTRIGLRLPREWLAMSPGFYMAIGNEAFAAPGNGGLIRFYWNVTPRGALELMRNATARLNKSRVPFKLKALNDPRAYRRCDAAVLYVQKSDFDRVREMLEETYSSMASSVLPDVPMFTKRMARGVGFAEDPGDSESFGSSRCGLVAEGLLKAFERRATSAGERLLLVERCFAEAGIRLDEPFLNSGSSDVYAFRRRAGGGTGAENGSPPRASHEPKALVDHASAIARRLCRGAFWSGGRCNWVGRLPEGAGHDDGGATRLVALGSDVYSGTAGLALFLAEIYAKTGDPQARKTALGAIRHALSRVDASARRLAPGFYAGWTGVALSAARAGKLLRAPVLLEDSASLIRRMATARYGREDLDVISGRAGAIPALLILRDLLGDPHLLALAVRMGDQLLQSAERRGPGLSWRAAAFSRSPSLTGFSHGAAGVGCALLELFQATGEGKYREAGLAAFRYERRWFDVDEGNWPDFRWMSSRRLERESAKSFPTTWCHGAPGIALSRLRAFEITGEDLCRSEAEIALKTTQGAVERDLARGGWDSSLCHGLAGNADVLLCGSQLLDGRTNGAPEVLSRVADAILAERSANDRLVEAAERSGASWGLMVGLAGVGYFCLRLSEPSTPSILMLRPESFLLTSRGDQSHRRPRHRSRR